MCIRDSLLAERRLLGLLSVHKRLPQEMCIRDSIRIEIVIAAHADHDQPGKGALDLARIVRVVAQMQDRIGFFPLDRIGHAHIIAVRIGKHQYLQILTAPFAAIAVFYTVEAGL